MSPPKVNRITWTLLLLGFGSALAIFLMAEPQIVDPLLGDQLGNKKYLRELRVMGGQGNVVAAEFQEWFAGLWQGRELAGTVAVLTVGTVLVFRFIALHPGVPVADADKEGPPLR